MSDSAEDSDDFDPQELLIVQELEKEEKGEVDEEKTFFYNAAGMEACCQSISLPSDFHWIETLSVTTPEPFLLPNAEDDLKRESMFYEQTLQGVKVALERLEETGVPFLRPTDFYAEMVKPDSHMARIKDSLIREKKKMAFVENRKKARQQQKMAKEIRAQRLKDKSAGKREAKAQLEAIKAKRGRNNSELSVPRTTLTANVKAAERKKSRKRQAKDAKFGFGGKKKRLKANTADSLDDASFPVRQNKSSSFKRRIKKGKGQKRPGKNARRKKRS